MLTNALRKLEADGFVHREQFNEIPPHVEYSFTEWGRDLTPVFYEIIRWGFKHEKDRLEYNVYKVRRGCSVQMARPIVIILPMVKPPYDSNFR